MENFLYCAIHYVEGVKALGNEALEDTPLSYREAAVRLGVSEATIRNWVKLGKLTAISLQGKEENRAQIFSSVLQKVQGEIASGSTFWLQTRRNKMYNSGYIIPTEYISSLQSMESIQALIECGQQMTDFRWLLLEIILNFLTQQNKGQLLQQFSAEPFRLDATSQNQDLSLSLTEELELGNLNVTTGENLILELRELIGTMSCPPENLPYLRKARSLKIPWIEGEDLLGFIYSSFSSLQKRKKQGSYYTPREIVEDIIQQCQTHHPEIVQNDEFKVLDPCCGSGNFLIHAFLSLRNLYLMEGRSLAEIEQFLMENVIWGWDLDSTALLLAKINLLLLLKHPLDKPCFPLLTCRNSLEFLENPLYPPAKFDWVLGNPPWGAKFYEPKTFAVEESAALFTQLGVQILKANGILGYVLPDSLLKAQKYIDLRSLLLEQTKVIEISDLGLRFSGVSSPAIAFIAQRHTSDATHKMRFKTAKGIQEISQTVSRQSPYMIINVHLASRELITLENIRSLPEAHFLKGHCDFALGIVTGDNQHVISSDCPPGGEVILKGSDIFRFKYRESKNYLVFNAKRFQQVAPEKFYRVKEKLIYRFINKHLVFAYDNQQRLSLNSANVIIPHLQDYDLFYVLALLNSRVAQFYHELTFDSVKILRQHIEAIPLPQCTLCERQTLQGYVSRLLQEENSNVRYELYETLDQLIMNLYQLSPRDQEIIKKLVGSVKYL